MIARDENVSAGAAGSVLVEPGVATRWIGGYELILPVASGGMATVYLARSRASGGLVREVALKLAHAHVVESGDLGVEMFEEAKLAARIRHTNVVPVFDVGDDRGAVFLVMEYVEGDTLGAIARAAAAAGTPLSPGVGLRILCDALEGLHAAHELRDESGAPQGLVHRDFSPQNVLLGLDGSSRLTDFGIATATTRVHHTCNGSIKGKISYMAPEQARGRALDRRCDVWAAGVMAWELLAGRRLYGNDGNDVARLLRLVTESPPPLRSVNPSVHPTLAAIVAAALTPDVADRTGSALELGSALSAACRATGLELPEHTEVGKIVERLVGPKLVERRARAQSIMAARSSATSSGGSQRDPHAAADAVEAGSTPAVALSGSERAQAGGGACADAEITARARNPARTPPPPTDDAKAAITTISHPPAGAPWWRRRSTTQRP